MKTKVDVDSITGVKGERWPFSLKLGLCGRRRANEREGEGVHGAEEKPSAFSIQAQRSSSERGKGRG